MERYIKTLDKAISHYGAFNQQLVCIEEMAELQQILAKDMARPKAEDDAHIAEEIADVQIMLWQMQRIFGLEEMVEDYIALKVARLETRMEVDGK